MGIDYSLKTRSSQTRDYKIRVVIELGSNSQNSRTAKGYASTLVTCISELGLATENTQVLPFCTKPQQGTLGTVLYCKVG